MKSRTFDKGLAFTVAVCTRKHMIALGLVGFAIGSVSGYATTYTDSLGDQQGSANLLRDISSATIVNDANNLYITLNLNPGANIATGGAFNYVIGITTGSPTAGWRYFRECDDARQRLQSRHIV